MCEQEKPFQWAEPEVPDELPEFTEDDGLSYTSVAELLDNELNIDIKRLSELDIEIKRLKEISLKIDPSDEHSV